MKYENAKQILFNAQMARAIQDGHKTQTRRVIKNDFRINEKGTYRYSIRDKKGLWNDFAKKEEIVEFASKFKKGDILWVREPAKVVEFTPVGNYGGSWNDTEYITYEYVSDSVVGICDLPDRFQKIPKWAQNKTGVPNGCIKEMARTFLKITNVRIEKLQDMEKRGSLDFRAEGCRCPIPNMWSENTRRSYIKSCFVRVWNESAPSDYKWEDNPYVFVYDFEVLQ